MARKLAESELDLAGVRDVTWHKAGTEWADDYTFWTGKEMKSINLGQDFYTYRIISAVKRVVSVSNTTSYTV